MDVTKWALELVDRATPAGKKIAASFAKVSDAAKKLGTQGAKIATKGLQKLGEKTAEVAPKIAKWAAIGLATATGGLIAAGGKLVADAIGFKDSTLIATRALLKSDALAGTAYKRMLDFARYFGEDPTDAIQRFNSALAAGFSAGDAEKLLQAFGDLKLITPNVNPDALVGAFGAIRSKGKLELADFQAAVSAGGLNLTLAYEAIGKKIGKNAKEVETLIGSGRVNAQVGLVGLLDAINQRTNSTKVGGKLTEYAETASGLMERLKGLPQQFALRLTADDSPIKGTLSKLLNQLDPDSPNGKRIIGALDTALASIGKTLETWATPEGIEKLTKMLGTVIATAPKIINAMGKIAGVVETVSDAFSSFTDNCRFLWAEFKRGEPIVTAMAVVLALPLAPIILTYKAFRNIGDFITTDLPKAWDELKKFAGKAADWGTDVVDGFWTGIKDAWKGLLKKITGLLDLLPDAAKKALGIASPSKVFAALGEYTAQGFNVGFSGAAPSMGDTIADGLGGGVASGLAAVSNISTTSSSIASSVNSRGDTIVHMGGVTIPDAKDARQAARDLGRELTRHLELANLGGV